VIEDRDLLHDLADRVTHRFYGKYRGTVVDNADPDGLFRIRATVPAVLHGNPTGWCLPCLPFAGKGVGMFFLPPKESAVWIEFEGGDIHHPIWTGCYWRAGERPAEATPSVRGIITPGSSKLLFDDSPGAPAVTVTDANGNTFTMDADGLRQSRGGSTLSVSDSSVSIDDGAFEVS
jgi:uncharacterized protein involved in type VI secretion and phage assembly